MKLLNGYRIRFVLVGFVASIVLSGGNARADFTFGEPTDLGPTVNTPYVEFPSCISADGLELYFSSDRPGGLGGRDLWAITRKTREDSWDAPVNLGPTINSSAIEDCSCMSADGLELYFDAWQRPGGQGAWDIWVSRRQTRNDPWSAAVNLGPPINSSSWDQSPSISADGLEFYFCSSRPGGQGTDDLWVAKRATKNDPWGEPVNLGATVNSSAHESGAKIALNSLLLFFSGDTISPYRPGGFGLSDIWMTRRVMRDNVWSKPVNLGPLVNSPFQEYGPVISEEDSTLFFMSTRPGGSGNDDIYQAPIIPIVDFNGDGIVDSADMCIMVDHWGENYSLCDIGPTPLGDGIVDVQDLIVIAEHLFEDYRLIAHWKLDEEEGNIAHDNANGHDGTIHGEPVWEYEEGMIDGALLLDGIDDYVQTDFILNPVECSFSVFAWLKGGVPGQVIISQADVTIDTPVGPSTNPGSTWLGANLSDGRLITGLMDTFFGPLESESIITDGQWRHIGLVYDFIAMKRRLYIDGAEVVVDAGYAGGVQSSGGLYIGAGQNLGTGTFFSGLIDDVRIYNVALTAEEIAALAQ
ncbi:MAG: hypothetical protein AMJ75_09610 [Phycisphaerae bacterium SM1_79]|nr:MAG: hypothetical protein AMJ75_09610 [Phycisphaerae bacterium SM1_79]